MAVLGQRLVRVLEAHVPAGNHREVDLEVDDVGVLVDAFHFLHFVHPRHRTALRSQFVAGQPFLEVADEIFDFVLLYSGKLGGEFPDLTEFGACFQGIC